MGGINNIDNFGQYDRASENQLSNLASDAVKTDDIHGVNDEKQRIWGQIADAAEFTDDEKREFKTELDSKDDTNLTEIRQFGRDILKQREEVRALIQSYTQIIESNKAFFGVDKARNFNAADEYIKEFMQQPLAEKRRWLSSLKADIDERISLYEQAAQLMPDQMSYVRTLKRSKLRELITERNESRRNLAVCEKMLSQYADLFTKEEIEDIKEELADATRPDQAKILDDVTVQLEERVELKKQFAELPDEYKKECGKFESLPLDEKRLAIAKVDQQITKDYRDIQRTHPLAKHISEDGKNQAFEKYIRHLPVNEKAKALKMLDKQFQYEKALSDQFEELLSELEELGVKKTETERLRINFYQAGYDKKKKELIPGAQKRIEEQEEREELAEKYEKLLDGALDDQYISAKTKKKALDKWPSRSLEDQRRIVHGFDALLAPRVALTKRFQSLPDEIQEEHSKPNTEKNFYDKSHHDRKDLITRLEQKLEDEETNKAANDNGDTEASVENAETVEEKIEILTKLAMNAERQKRYVAAERYYEQILELDPEDEIAQNRLEAVQQKIAEEMDLLEETDEESTDQGELDNLVQEAMESQELRQDREDRTILETIATETMGSENATREIEAQYRTHDVDEDDKEIADQLTAYSEGTMVLNDEGEAEEVVKVKDGLSGLAQTAKNDLKRKAVKDIIQSAEQDNWTKHMQIVNEQGQSVSAKKGLETAEKMQEEMVDKVVDMAAQRARKHGTKVNKDQLKETAEEQDFDIELPRAA